MMPIRFQSPFWVLLVEDNVVNQRLAQINLKNTGVELAFASHGVEAIEIVKNQQIDIILMDVQMPVLDGLSAARLILEICPDMPIIGLSANIYEEDIEACYAAGMVDFLGKPYSRENLFQILYKHKPPHISLQQNQEIYTTVATNTSNLVNSEKATVSLSILELLFEGDTQGRNAFISALAHIFEDFLQQSILVTASQWAQCGPTLSVTLHKLRPNLKLVGLESWHDFGQNLEKDLKAAFSEESLARLQVFNLLITNALPQLTIFIK